MAKMPNVELPIDGAGGKSGLFWHPTSVDPKNYYRSYARTGHYDSIISRPNFEVITMHKVKKIDFDGTTATGVSFFERNNPDQVLVVKAKKEVIVSAGTVHTPQILQNSGIGPKDLLKEADIPVLLEIPGVGQNFQDHAYLSVIYRCEFKFPGHPCNRYRTSLIDKRPAKLTNVSSPDTNGTPPVPEVTLTGSQSTLVGSNVGAWIPLRAVSEDYEELASRYEAQDPAEYLPENSHPSIVAGYAAFQKLHVKLLRAKDTNLMWMPLGGGATGGVIMSMHIVSHGTININPKNPHAEPIVDYRALSNPIDLDIMVENIKFVRKFMKSPDFAPYVPVETSPGIDVTGEELKEWVRRQIIPTNFHPIATAAKKPLDMGGVVDEELLVHGTKHLRVVDGSVMPLLPGANTQQTVYMLAEKVSRPMDS